MNGGCAEILAAVIGGLFSLGAYFLAQILLMKSKIASITKEVEDMGNTIADLQRVIDELLSDCKQLSIVMARCEERIAFVKERLDNFKNGKK